MCLFANDHVWIATIDQGMRESKISYIGTERTQGYTVARSSYVCLKADETVLLEAHEYVVDILAHTPRGHLYTWDAVLLGVRA